jgi:DNA-binding NtrC family response regulator
MVYSIITAHQGAIHVASQRGIGTTLSFILPALNLVPEEATQPELRQLPRGQECILVVEDDELVRSMVTTALCMGGYSVITANDGEEGQQQFIEHRDHIDLVMVDQTMPKRSGRELIREIREIDKDMRIIFTSGFGTHEEDFIPPGSTNVAFIGKPYSLPDLLQKVRDLLEPPE